MWAPTCTTSTETATAPPASSPDQSCRDVTSAHRDLWRQSSWEGRYAAALGKKISRGLVDRGAEPVSWAGSSAWQQLVELGGEGVDMRGPKDLAVETRHDQLGHLTP